MTMKKAILTTTLFFIVFSVYTQNDQTWRFGLKGSPSISWISPDTRHYEHNKVNIGFSYGIICDRHISEFYAISGGAFITSHGGKISLPESESNDNDETIEKQDYRLQYIDIPLSMKMRTRKFGHFTFYGQFGISGGFNISATKENIPEPDDYYDDDIRDDINLAKFSSIIGAGTEYSLLGNTALLFGFYYNNGFSNIIKDSSNGLESATSDFFELTVGVMF